MEESNSSALAIIAIILAALAVGGVGLGVTNNSAEDDARVQTIRLNILPSQKFTTTDGTEYSVGSKIRLPLGEKLVGVYSSSNCLGETKSIDGEFDSIFNGVPLCEADCNDDNSRNLELLADSVNTCDDYFNRQLTGTDTEEISDVLPDEEDLEDFPENYIFGEEVK